MRFIREMFASYVQKKCAIYVAAAQHLLTYPEGSFGYERGKLMQAMCELYYALAEAFGGAK